MCFTSWVLGYLGGESVGGGGGDGDDDDDDDGDDDGDDDEDSDGNDVAGCASAVGLRTRTKKLCT